MLRNMRGVIQALNSFRLPLDGCIILFYGMNEGVGITAMLSTWFYEVLPQVIEENVVSLSH